MIRLDKKNSQTIKYVVGASSFTTSCCVVLSVSSSPTTSKYEIAQLLMFSRTVDEIIDGARKILAAADGYIS